MKGVAYTIIALLVGMIFLVVTTLQPSKFPLYDYFEIKNQVDAFRWNVKVIIGKFITVGYNGTGYWINASPKKTVLDDIQLVAKAQNITYEDNNFSSNLHMWNDYINVKYLNNMPTVNYQKPDFIYLIVIANVTRARRALVPGDVPCHIIVANESQILLDVQDNISYARASRVITDAGIAYVGPYVYIDFNSTMNLFLKMNGSYELQTNATFVYRGGKFNLTIKAI